MQSLERFFFHRPRILNVLHKLKIVCATSQTYESELSALERYAKGARAAVEIGTYQGVSAARIANSLAANGVLFCIDPWPGGKNRNDPNLAICQRHLNRTGVTARIRLLRGYSNEQAEKLPKEVDFAFIDGDHSWAGIEKDWNLIAPRLAKDGIVCLHDTVVPATEPWRQFDSVRFYNERIAPDNAFETVDTVHSMRVIRKR